MNEQDLLGMWIAGEYDELFATLRAMTPDNRAVELLALYRAMRDFDECNSDENPTDEYERFLHECMERL